MEVEGEFESEGEFRLIETELPKSLTKYEASDCLNCVAPTFRLVDKAFTYSSCTYAYVAMNIVDRNLTNVDVLSQFTHVMFLDLSRNRLTDENLTVLAEMEQLVTLTVDRNRLEFALVPVFPQLQILSLKDNRITSCEMNYHPNLEYLELCGNSIQQIEPSLWEPKRLPKLRELGLRNNGLISTAGINFPNLVSLFLADNEITNLEGLEMLPNLKFLHLRNNPLKKLDGFSENNRKLFYINVRGCLIRNSKEFKKLTILPRLERIVVTDNPFAKKNYRIQVIAFLPNLRKIDKTLVEKTEKRKAKKLAKRMITLEGDGDDEDKENENEEDEEIDGDEDN